jgi:uncharacterized protein YecA (UPF0149 family)
MLTTDKENLRKMLEEEERKQHKHIPCASCGNEMTYQGFVFFDDPCICGSGKNFKQCCYKTLEKKKK